MKARFFALLTAATVFACSTKHDAERLRRVEAAASAHSQAVDDVAVKAARLNDAWDDVRVGFDQAARENLAAQAALTKSADAYGAASAQSREAAAVAEKASARWQLFQQLVVAAALLDAANLDAARTAAQGSANALSCDSGMSTAAFRALLTSQGVNLAGKDIDHIVPRSLGGADNPANYQVLPSSVNRSLGATWNAEKCKAVGAKECARAITVSRKCGALKGLGFT